MRSLGVKLALVSVFVSTQVLYAQEYDDMYFSSKDRMQVKYANESAEFSEPSSKQLSNELNTSNIQNEYEYSDSYSARNVNPEYIARYRQQAQDNAEEDFEVSDSYSREE